MPFVLLLACSAPPVDDPALDTAVGDTGGAESVLVRRLRANYEVEEGVNLAEGEVVVLRADNETEPEADHADLHATLGRYVGLSTYAPEGEGRLCTVGEGFTAVEAVPTTCVSDWTSNVACAVNSDLSEPACVGLGLVVRTLDETAIYRARVLTDEIAADGDFLAGITLEIQRVRSP